MKKNKYYILSALLMLVSIQFGCLKKADLLPQAAADNRPILTILKNNYAFSMLYGALQRTGLDKTLEGNGPFTLLAPDNDAFNNSGITADSLAKIDTATLKKLIGYHIIKANIPYNAIPQAIDFPYQSLAGPAVYFSLPKTQTGAQTVHINGVTVKKMDIQAVNGYIIVLNKVLYYPAGSVKAILEGNPRYSFFTKALKKFGLFDQLDKTGPFTIMAPSNDAFLQNGMDETAINALDTVNYKKFLFSAYILSPYKFFVSDLTDAPLSNTAVPGVVTPDFIQVTNPGNGSNPATYGLISLDWKAISVYQLPPYYGNFYIYGPAVQIDDPDHLALNGIVHGLNGIVMPVDSARIH